MASPKISYSWPREMRSYRKPLVVAGLACLALVVCSRSPDLLLTARFFAEDGQVFYQHAHELGFLHSVWVTYAGYLHLFPSLIAGISLWLPLYYVPLFFNVVALTIHWVTALYICSPRTRNIGPVPLRVLIALLYLGLPHIGEVWGKLVNSQWQLAVLSFLILIAEPPRSRAGTWFDVGALAIGALTGPFSILLLPIALLVAFFRRSSRTVIQLAIVALGATVQGVLLLTKGRPPNTTTLGATLPLFCKIVVRFLLLGFLPAGHRLPRFLEPLMSVWVLAACLLIIFALAGWMVRQGNFELRCMLLFGAAVTAASLASPIIVSNGEQWPVMLTGAGERYWFIPRLVVAVAMLWLVVQPFSKWARAAGVAGTLAIAICCAAGWHIAQWPGIHFRTYLHVFDALPVGAQLTVPIDPPPSWTLQLTKKPFDPMSHNLAFADGSVLGEDEWRHQLSLTRADESPASLSGEVFAVNGSPIAGRGSVTTPVHVAVRDGALLEGWAVLPTHDGLLAMDQMYAMLYDRVVQGYPLPRLLFYRNTQLHDATYLVFLPSTVLRPGLQVVTLMGYSRAGKMLHTCKKSFYIYGD